MKYSVSLNGKIYEVDVEETQAVITAVTDAPSPAAQAVSAPAAPSAPQPAAPAVTGGNNIIAPMPGTILSVSVTEGQKVESGEVVMILEAMKMENEIVAPCAGTITKILVQKGTAVDTGTALAVIG